MARVARLSTAGRAGRQAAVWLAGLAILVLVAHWLALAWLAAQWQQPSVLRPLATPMFTRQILPAAPPSPPPAAPIPARNPAPAPASKSLAAISSVASQPQPSPTVAPPQPDPQPSAQPDLANASATASIAAATPTAAPAPDTAAGAGNLAYLDSWPADTRLTYLLSGQFRGELHGNARVQWQRQGSRYQARIEIDIGWLASVALTSQGVVGPDGLLPQAYEEQVRNNRRSVQLDEQELTLQDGSKVPRPAGVQDTASQFVELTHLFATVPQSLQAGNTVRLWLARPGGVDEWVYDILQPEVLVTPRMGSVQAWHLKPRPLANPRGTITAEMWFAPTLQYLPVRIRMNLNADTYVDLLIDRIEQADTRPLPPS